MKSWWATGASRALGSALCAVLGTVLALAVSGCAMVTAVVTPVAGSAPAVALATTGAQPGREVPAAIAQTLASAPSGGTMSFQLADGRPASFTLGAIFQSGSGVPCRIGQVNPRQVRFGEPTEYPFCRQGDRWFEMTAVVVSSNK